MKAQLQPTFVCLAGGDHACFHHRNPRRLSGKSPARREIVESGDLKRTRWSLAQAMENAGLADHMGSANSNWLAAIRLELVELRGAIRTLSHDFEERVCPSSTAKEATPHTS